MGYEETNPQDISSRKVFELLKPIFPDIIREDIIFYYHGTYNVFFVKKEYIFRFPDKSFYNEKGYNMISREVEFLDTIRKEISIKIPKPLYVSDDQQNPFVGYKKIPGISLSRCYKKTKKEEQILLGKELAAFLSEYHSPKLTSIIKKQFYKDMDTSTANHRRTWEEHRRQIEQKVHPLLTEEEKEWVRSIFADFLDNDENFNFTPTTVHGDLDTSNILVNPETYQITGIIDFEDGRIGDPAYDLIFIDEGEVFCKALFNHYKQKIDQTLELRRRFYFCRAGTIYIYTGIELSYPRMIQYGKKLIKERMKQFPQLKI